MQRSNIVRIQKTSEELLVNLAKSANILIAIFEADRYLSEKKKNQLRYGRQWKCVSTHHPIGKKFINWIEKPENARHLAAVTQFNQGLSDVVSQYKVQDDCIDEFFKMLMGGLQDPQGALTGGVIHADFWAYSQFYKKTQANEQYRAVLFFVVRQLDKLADAAAAWSVYSPLYAMNLDGLRTGVVLSALEKIKRHLHLQAADCSVRDGVTTFFTKPIPMLGKQILKLEKMKNAMKEKPVADTAEACLKAMATLFKSVEDMPKHKIKQVLDLARFQWGILSVVYTGQRRVHSAICINQMRLL